MDPFIKVQMFEPLERHFYESNISLISLISLMFNYAKPRLLQVWQNLCYDKDPEIIQKSTSGDSNEETDEI